MTRWFTSDTHFSHANIIQFCDRPFVDVEEMNNKIVNRINELVSPDDELWILGDLAMGDITKSLSVVSRILAEKVIVLGNHDRAHPYYGSKHALWFDKYLAETKAKTMYAGNTSITLKDGTIAQVSHFPYTGRLDKPKVVDRNGKTIEGDKFEKYRVLDDGSWLICGHVHEKWAVQKRQINIGLDAWGGDPVSEDTIVDIIATGPQDKPRIVWK